jgi:hypothetical protein
MYLGDRFLKLTAILIELVTPGDPLPNLSEYWLFRWDLEGPANIFTTTNLPEAAFPLAPWTTNRWSISLWGSPPAPLLELPGAVNSFQSVVVPEPASIVCAAWLAILGIFLRTAYIARHSPLSSRKRE